MGVVYTRLHGSPTGRTMLNECVLLFTELLMNKYVFKL